MSGGQVWLLVFILIVGLLIFAGMNAAAIREAKGGKGRRGAGGLARSGLNQANKQTIQQKWQEIETLVNLGKASNLKSAVIEADKLLDFTLKALGASGETLGERLRSAEPRFSDYNGTWQAHKLRNRIVHEADHELQASEVQVAIRQFRRALADLGGLQ